jgi:hypothetical protein
LQQWDINVFCLSLQLVAFSACSLPDLEGGFGTSRGVDNNRSSKYNNNMTRDPKKEKKSNEQVVNPHDKVVKEFLSEKEIAESFFREYLPREITAGLDFSTLKLAKESFVDKKLSAYFSDLLYEVKSNNQSTFIYLLIEHKSWVDSLTAFQLLKYMVRIWELYLKQHGKAKTLPVIIPVVLYHGEQPWNIETNFISLLEAGCPGNMRAYIPDFRFILLDISHLPDEEIKGAVLRFCCVICPPVRAA